MSGALCWISLQGRYKRCFFVSKGNLSADRIRFEEKNEKMEFGCHRKRMKNCHHYTEFEAYYSYSLLKASNIARKHVAKRDPKLCEKAFFEPNHWHHS